MTVTFHSPRWLAMAVVAVGAVIALGCTPATDVPVKHTALASVPVGGDEATARTAAWLEAHREDLPLLRSFLVRMPKGGDIHNHLSGAVYAESYIAWAAEASYCMDVRSESVGLAECPGCPDGDPYCTEGLRDGATIPVARALDDQELYNQLIDKMSVRNLLYSGRSGHAQFFSTFAEFGDIASRRRDDMVVEVASRAASEHTSYLELMITLQSRSVRRIGQKVGLSGDLVATRKRLLDAGLRDLVAAGRRDLDEIESERIRTMKCGTPEAVPGCKVTVRYLQQTIRTRPPEQVFAQLVYAFELVSVDPRVVGINLVAPEDNRVALTDYTRHMEMMRLLSTQVPGVPIALHAGELVLGLVRPEDLRFHIRQAVEIAGARRIGHGVAISYEDDAMDLFATMRKRDVLVEVCLTSNDVILDVEGAEHPITAYRHMGVPVALATDDAGVSRIDLSHEFMRATTTYGLDYHDLKELARNSLSYSFLPGSSLWRARAGGPSISIVSACAGDAPGAAIPSPECARFLATSVKAREQWLLEADFAEFERLPAWREP